MIRVLPKSESLQVRLTLKAGQTLWLCAEGERPVAIREDSHYKLGYPVEEVVASHILTEMEEVTWCSATQQWVS